MENLERGRCHTLLLTVFTHNHLGHLLSTLIFAPHVLSLTFRSCLFKPWYVVILMAGSEIASNLGTAGKAWLALRASPPNPEEATTEKEIDEQIYRRGGAGASGMISGVTASLAYLYPTARLFRFVPLWIFVPWLILSDFWGESREGTREHFRKQIEAERTGVGLSGSNVNHTAHLSGAAIGVFFALLKRRLGSRL